MSVMFILYILIIKHSNKIFKSKKQLIIAICIISVLFALIIPYTSTDVYSYIANGWSASHYHENPYYKSVGQISDEHQVRDQMYNKLAVSKTGSSKDGHGCPHNADICLVPVSVCGDAE